MNTIQDGWDSYCEMVVNSGACDVQIRETKQAFYAGAIHLLRIMLRLGDSSTTLDGGAAVLEGIRQEILGGDNETG